MPYCDGSTLLDMANCKQLKLLSRTAKTTDDLYKMKINKQKTKRKAQNKIKLIIEITSVLKTK